MTDLTQNFYSDNQRTMSSLEIAELTHKNHFDVMRDVRVSLGQLAGLSEEEIKADANLLYLTNQGVIIEYDDFTKNTKCYKLPRRICDLVISGYAVKYRMIIIDRWHELEGKKELTLEQLTLQAITKLSEKVKE